MGGIFRSFWGSLVMLIALMIVLEQAGGFSTVAKATTGFVSGTVNSFKT
jgi:hypothetical protein